MKLFLAFLVVLSALLSLHQAEAVDCSYQKPGCFTTLEENPVCGANGCNYNNPGKAECGGTTVAYYGYCY